MEEYYETDSSDGDENHSRLISSVSQLDSTQRVKPAQRKEASTKVSEYNLTERIPSKKSLISVNELADVLNKSSKHVAITKTLKNVTSKFKTLPKPLEKPQEEQIKRSIGFQNVKNQLERWDAVVTRNALKDKIIFPLNDNSMTMQKSDEFLDQFQSSTPLEKEIMKVLNQEDKKEKQEDDKEFSLTLEEMLEKRREMAYLRAKLSHKEAKAQRQNKIKSKKYHRILRREKLRQQIKEFELLQKTDPEAALKKLTELDKTRAQERATLRHRNTGQWAKNLSVRAKYDTESRKILAEQLKISRELTQKINEMDESDKEEENEPVSWNSVSETASKEFANNPWNINISKEVQEFVSGYKKYWSEKNKAQSEDAINKEAEECLEKDIEKTSERKDVKVNGIEVNSKGNEIEINGKINEIEKNAKCTEIQKSPQTNLKKAVKRKKDSEKPKTVKIAKSVSIYPGSGVWIVTPDNEGEDEKEVTPEDEGEANVGDNKKKSIDTLFEELDDKLMENAKVKMKEIENNLKKEVKKKKSQVKKTVEKKLDLTLKNKNTVERPDLDVGLLENDETGLEAQSGTGLTPADNTNKTSATDIDPQNFIQVKPKRLKTYLPDMMTKGEDNDEKKQVMSIEEAFVDDDVIAEFKEMKDECEKSKEIVIETSLPGWGNWGGSGILPKTRKNSRLIINPPPRKDKEKKDVIINENANPKMKNHKVKEVPHPFRSVEAFEANIRVPVGREWVPETAHWKLIEKQVETKLGAVIDPMDEVEIVRQKKCYQSPYQGKKKTQEKKRN